MLNALNLPAILTRVERRLEAVGLTATAASKLAGKPDAVRNMRRAVAKGGRQGISTATLQALAPVLQTTAAWLTEGIGDEIAESAPSTESPVKITHLNQYLPPDEAVAFVRWCMDFLEERTDEEGAQDFLEILIEVLRKKGDETSIDLEQLRSRVRTLLLISKAQRHQEHRKKP